mgnify:CR=1 FL=1
MQNSKLLNLVKSFSPEEWKAFGLFLQSPYHNTSQQALLLYRYLENCYPKFPSEQVNRKQIYSIIYPNEEKYIDRRLRDLFSGMTQLIHSFLTLEQLQKEATLSERLAIEALNNHKQYREANKKSDALVNSLEEASQSTLSDYAHLQWLHHQRYFHAETTQQAHLANHLRKAYESADDFYYLSKLRCVSEFLARAFQIQEDQPFDQKQIQKLLDDSQPFESKNLLLKCYRHLVLVFREKGRYSWPLYQELKHIFFKNWQGLPDVEVQIFYKHMYNYLVNMTRQNEELYEPEKLILYRFAIGHNLLVYDNTLSLVTFTNIAFLGSKVGAFEWTENFITSHQKYLHHENRNEVVALSWAALAFYKKEWRKARDQIIQLYFRNVNFELFRRSLLLRTHFEIYVNFGEGDESFSTHVDTFQHFLNRKETVQRSKAKPYLNLIRFTKRLARLKYDPNQRSLKRLKQDIKNCEQLIFKPWITSHFKAITPEAG